MPLNAWVKGIFLLLFFYLSSDKLHFSAVILSTKLSKRISYQVFPSRPQQSKHTVPVLLFFSPPIYFFLKKEKNNIFFRWLSAFISFQGGRTVYPEGQSCKLTIKKTCPPHTPGKGMHTGVKMGNIQGQEVLHYPQKAWVSNNEFYAAKQSLSINTSFSTALKTLYEVAGG